MSSHMRIIAMYLFEKFSSFILKWKTNLQGFGQENLPEGGFILCSNHCSHIDSVVLMLATGKSFKNFSMIAAEDYFFKKIYRLPLLLILNLIPISRESNARGLIQCIKICKEHLKKGRIIIIYPEGTRSLDGQIQPLKKGISLLAMKLEAPIVPAYINGAFETVPKGTKWLKSHPVKVFFGKPIFPEKKDTESLMEELRRNIQELKEAQES